MRKGNDKRENMVHVQNNRSLCARREGAQKGKKGQIQDSGERSSRVNQKGDPKHRYIYTARPGERSGRGRQSTGLEKNATPRKRSAETPACRDRAHVGNRVLSRPQSRQALRRLHDCAAAALALLLDAQSHARRLRKGLVDAPVAHGRALEVAHCVDAPRHL